MGSINGANTSVFHGAAPYVNYPVYTQQNPRINEAPQQAHVLQNRNIQRRTNDGEGKLTAPLELYLMLRKSANRYANMKLEALENEIYTLCKDQHGCRYLQKKLEEGNPQYVEMIFNETHSHVVELMTGMFSLWLHYVMY